MIDETRKPRDRDHGFDIKKRHDVEHAAALPPLPPPPLPTTIDICDFPPPPDFMTCASVLASHDDHHMPVGETPQKRLDKNQL